MDAAAGVASGATALFGYNRENYFYDREMRLEMEFKLREYRNRQAGLWRDDVREIVGLTERKMDTYRIVSALQLGMCVVLFTEGRLEPGTPPWLLHLYMLTLGAAFMYLLMSLWLALHASVVAQCSSVRLLTQFVRLPVPTWAELQEMRTYAQSAEQLGGKRLLRVPFLDRLIGRDRRPEASATAADPWELEAHGDFRDIYELEHMPAAARRHIHLARRAGLQYQCFDAFSRVCMTFGTNQLLHAITYYCLGYACLQDGAPWPALCVAAIMAAIAVAMIHLDLSLSKQEQAITKALLLLGPACASVATWAWALKGRHADTAVLLLLPFAYAAHGLWLLWALRVCDVQRQPNGAMLPLRFRAVLYLDVFGWLSRTDVAVGPAAAHEAYASYVKGQPPRKTNFSSLGWRKAAKVGSASPNPLLAEQDLPAAPQVHQQLHEELREHVALWESEKVQQLLGEHERARVERLGRRFREAGGTTAIPETTQPTPSACSTGPKSESSCRGAASRAAGALPGGGLPELSDSSRGAGPKSKCEEAGKAGKAGKAGEAGEARGAGDAGSRAPSDDDGPAPSGPWLKLYGYSDVGTEVPYLYQPDTGEVAEPPTEPKEPLFAPTAHGGAIRSITFAEDEVERYCTLRQSFPGSLTPSLSAGVAPALALPEELACCASVGGLGRVNPESTGGQHTAGGTCCEGGVAGEDAGGAETEGEGKAAATGPAAALGAAMALAFARCDAPCSVDAHDHNVEQDTTEVSPSNRRRCRGGSSSPASPSGPFSPLSFLPAGARSSAAAEGREAVTGLDREPPGQLPWKLFRRATMMLITLWTLGLLAPFWGIRDLATQPLLPQMMITVPERGEDVAAAPPPSPEPAGSESWDLADIPGVVPFPVEPDVASLPQLPQGEAVTVAWPRHSGFAPRALSCDPSGTHLVVADDFGVYAGDLQLVQAPAVRKLRGDSPTTQPPSRFALEFESVPPCPALEGQALRDIGLVCTGAAGAPRACRALVLHSQGERMDECPLTPNVEEEASRQRATWLISSEWLQGDPEDESEREQVESVAVHGGCLGSEGSADDGALLSPDEAGCVVAGTTSGRIVQLRRHLTSTNRLVPERAMQQQPKAVRPGSLHIFPTGFVLALHQARGSLQAFDTWTGQPAGEWRMPSGVRWLTLCGGGGRLFVLGSGPEGDLRLMRFPVPPELEKLRVSA